MPLIPHNTHEHYQTTLQEQLLSVTALIRTYVSTLKSHTPNLTTLSNRLWELRQRHRLVIGVEEAAANRLLTASHDVYQQIYQIIQSQIAALEEIASLAAEFQRTSSELRLEGTISWNAWLLETLSVLQTQAKYLQLHTRSLHPTAIEGATVKRFREDLQLVKEYELDICVGVARAERQQEFL
ncbi:hypothetical protein KR044_005872 [Drosophila immigrans]|nr:hypothetical protein KR044_005872 [Drosophila immigrans]